MWKNWNPYTLLVEMQTDAAIEENRLAVPQKLKRVPYDLAILFLGIYPRELKTNVHTKSCTRTFNTLLLIVAKDGNVHQLMRKLNVNGILFRNGTEY